jgi:hypothetical protein
MRTLVGSCELEALQSAHMVDSSIGTDDGPRVYIPQVPYSPVSLRVHTFF